jgi:transposase
LNNNKRGITVRRLSMRKISEVLRLRFELKCSYRDIARGQNISTSTVHDYLARAKAAKITWPLPENLSEEELFNRLFLPVNASKKKRPVPDWEWVHCELRKKAMTLRLLWREYRDIHADGLSYTQYCEHYRAYVKQISPVMRQIYKAGEKTFVDYAGMTVPWLDTTTGEIRQAQIFVGSLGASQYTFVEATQTQTIPDWIQSHIHMWEYFGGVSVMTIPDNLKSGVTKAHRYDPDINANYQHLGEHYGFAIVPARAVKPKDKAKVENAVGNIERQILAAMRDITFTSIAQINAEIKSRLIRFNSQAFQKMKTSRLELFEAVDKPALKPLPADKYQYAQWHHAKVHIDYHFVFDDHYYSVPYQYIHHDVEVRSTSNTVECFYKNNRIAVHMRSYARYKFTTLNEHMPKSHRAHVQWTPERMKRWANKIGPQTHQFIEHMIASRPFPEQAYRACLGVLRLGERFGAERLEKACRIAYGAGATRYKSVEDILKNKLDLAPSAENQTPLITPLHENIRGPHYYQ